ncbi:hypothetical protein M758_UG133700 [Ceratodon purpureus]|nr:hypothetical protein M758_UG133700 [Ceratodon purpureus]
MESPVLETDCTDTVLESVVGTLKQPVEDSPVIEDDDHAEDNNVDVQGILLTADTDGQVNEAMDHEVDENPLTVPISMEVGRKRDGLQIQKEDALLEALLQGEGSGGWAFTGNLWMLPDALRSTSMQMKLKRPRSH